MPNTLRVKVQKYGETFTATVSCGPTWIPHHVISVYGANGEDITGGESDDLLLMIMEKAKTYNPKSFFSKTL